MGLTRTGPGRGLPEEVASLALQVLNERDVSPVYQPIVELATRRIVGVEALARGPTGSAVESPEVLLAAAETAGVLDQMDQMMFGRAVEVAWNAAEFMPPLLFVNAEPTAVGASIDPGLLTMMRAPKPFRVVMEFTERALALHPEALLDLAHRGWNDGNALALDDVGVNSASLAFLPLFAPEVVKLDRSCLQDPTADGTRATTSLVSAYAETADAVILVEGIEAEPDVARAIDLGARWGQGWLFGRPGPLTEIAGRPIHEQATLRRPQRDGIDIDDSPFVVLERVESSAQHYPASVNHLLRGVIAVAERGGRLAVIVGGYPNPVVGRAWLALLGPRADAFGYAGLVGPQLPDPDGGKVRLTTPRSAPPPNEALLLAVAPGKAVALGLRLRDDGTTDCAMTYRPDLVRRLAWMLLRQSAGAR